MSRCRDRDCCYENPEKYFDRLRNMRGDCAIDLRVYYFQPHAVTFRLCAGAVAESEAVHVQEEQEEQEEQEDEGVHGLCSRGCATHLDSC